MFGREDDERTPAPSATRAHSSASKASGLNCFGSPQYWALYARISSWVSGGEPKISESQAQLRSSQESDHEASTPATLYAPQWRKSPNFSPCHRRTDAAAGQGQRSGASMSSHSAVT
eukprot:CAMPEP_0185793174 /NCGR_PEP_ID=MMETSP1174-20130828/159327_1 /TAXON_ID=35687 /ORGANISM="Dictyocha speculum, Strain CCMP1381" /LENGTH=116 /DNA_ID=CAMNT_0028488291 /DNA_START=703 /DNA_END=1054 /DNA_ORIENTATION=-